MDDIKQKVGPADLFKLQFILDARLSPDGQKVIYAVERVDAEKEIAYTTLFLLDVDTLGTRQLTDGAHNDSSPRWSPDGKTIAFVSDRSEIPQIFVMPVDGGEARALTALEQGVGSPPAWSLDGKRIAFTAGPEKPPIDKSKPYRVNRHLYRFDAIGLVENSLNNIYSIAIADDEVKRLTNSPDFKMNLRWSPEGNEILYQCGIKPDSFQYKTTLEVVNLEGEAYKVFGDWGWAGAAKWMPDGERICFVGKERRVINGTKQDLWIVDKKGLKPPECFTASLKVGVAGDLQGDIVNLDLFSGEFFIDPQGKYAIIQVQEGGKVGIDKVSLEVKDSYEKFIGGERACAAIGTDFKRVLFLAATHQEPGDLYSANLDGTGEKRLTFINQKVIDSWMKPVAERIVYPSVDGAEIEGWVMKPDHGTAPFPSLVYPHGGPHYAFGYMYCFDVHMMTSAGYAVLLINHRASTGYGSAFATGTNKDWGNLDYEDIMVGVDFAIDKGITDPDRLGCFGLSFGGYMSCWIVGQTNRFKAAVPENPVTNFVSFYGVSQTEGPAFAVEELGGKPYEIPEVYARCSPITYAHKCTTPTLLIQGEEDNCCPPEESEQFYTVLKDNGCIVEMLRLPGSSHTGSISGAPITRRVQNEALLEWMDKYLKKPGEKHE